MLPSAGYGCGYMRLLLPGTAFWEVVPHDCLGLLLWQGGLRWGVTPRSDAEWSVARSVG